MAKRLPRDVVEFLRAQGRKGGLIGGKRSLETMTKAARVKRAKIASAAAAAARKAKAEKARDQ